MKSQIDRHEEDIESLSEERNAMQQKIEKQEEDIANLKKTVKTYLHIFYSMTDCPGPGKYIGCQPCGEDPDEVCPQEITVDY